MSSNRWGVIKPFWQSGFYRLVNQVYSPNCEPHHNSLWSIHQWIRSEEHDKVEIKNIKNLSNFNSEFQLFRLFQLYNTEQLYANCSGFRLQTLVLIGPWSRNLAMIATWQCKRLARLIDACNPIAAVMLDRPSHYAIAMRHRNALRAKPSPHTKAVLLSFFIKSITRPTTTEALPTSQTVVWTVRRLKLLNKFRRKLVVHNLWFTTCGSHNLWITSI